VCVDRVCVFVECVCVRTERERVSVCVPIVSSVCLTRVCVCPDYYFITRFKPSVCALSALSLAFEHNGIGAEQWAQTALTACGMDVVSNTKMSEHAITTACSQYE